MTTKQQAYAEQKAELESYAARINLFLPADRRVVVYDDLENEPAYMMIIELEDGECSGEIGYFMTYLLTGTVCEYAGSGNFPQIALGINDEEVAANIAALTF